MSGHLFIALQLPYSLIMSFPLLSINGKIKIGWQSDIIVEICCVQ